MPAVRAVAIGTLRLTGADADTPALRLRATRALAGADLGPPGLPPAAVLVVRRLADAPPRRLAGPDRAWERAVRERLAAAARDAARPDRRGALPTDAAAVLFADEAELLACAVREQVHGRLAERWWWRAVRRRLPRAATAGLGGGSDPAALLADFPREIPAALDRLARWGVVAAVAEAISPAGAARAVVALVAAYGLTPDLAAWADDSPNADLFPSTREIGHLSSSGAALSPAGIWREWLPAGLRSLGLTVEVQRLVGLALGLAVAPHRLRGSTARRWWQAAAAARAVASATAARPTTAPAALDLTPAAPPPSAEIGTSAKPASAAALTIRQDESSTTRQRARDAEPTVSASPLSLLSSAVDDASTVQPRRAQEPIPRTKVLRTATAAPSGRRERRSEAEPSATPGESAQARIDARLPVAVPPPVPRQPEAAAVERPSALTLATEGITTRIGGVLYVIHALLDLGLPEAFERGWRLASEAGHWGTLDLLGRGLLGARFSEVANDPLWAALEELAGWGSAASPRHRARATPAWRVPTSWPAKFADAGDHFSWCTAGRRLRLWSPAGWLLADVRYAGGPPSRQARRELARVLGDCAAATGRLSRRAAAAAPLVWPPPPLPPGCPARFGHWLAAAVPAVHRRLLLALTGGDKPVANAAAALRPGAPSDPVARAIAVSGRLFVTSSHLDLVLPLAASDLAVRRAGLDRDPGWQPAFGRVVSFHFD